MVRALLVILLLGAPLRAWGAEGGESTPTRPTISFRRALTLTVVPAVAGGAVLLSLAGVGAGIGGMVMAGYVLGPSSLADPYTRTALPLYALGGVALGVLAALPLALLASGITNLVGWLVLASADVPVGMASPSPHVVAGLASAAVTAAAVVLSGALASALLVNRIRQGGLQRDVMGVLLGSAAVMGAALLPLVPLLLVMDVLGRGALFWWMERRQSAEPAKA